MIEAYLEYVKNSEPPVNFHRWSFISCMSAALARNVKLQFGRSYIYPNMYVSLVGAPGTRKSSAIGTAKELLELAGFDRFSATKTSKQKFLLDWEESIRHSSNNSFLQELAASEEVNNIYIACDELLDFLGPSNFDFLNLLTTLWDNLGKYEERLKNSKSTCILNPTVSMLGGLTPIGLQMALPPEAAGTGMMSRMLFVYAESTKLKIAWPEVPTMGQKLKFKEFFSRLLLTHGEMKVSPGAKELLAEIYGEWEPLEDARLQYYCSRRYTHLLKLCIIVSVMRGDDLLISVDHVIEANTILSYAEVTMPLALGEFGKSKYSEASQMIVQYLEDAKRPVGGQELFRIVSRSVDKFADFSEIIRNLLRAERITSNGTTFICKKRQVKDNSRFTDYVRYIPENPTNDHSSLRRVELPLEALPTPDGETGAPSW